VTLEKYRALEVEKYIRIEGPLTQTQGEFAVLRWVSINFKSLQCAQKGTREATSGSAWIGGAYIFKRGILK
jgi:hypothetical protein